MIRYSSGPLRSWSGSNICPLFHAHAASQGIEPQTHYGFVFQSHRPGTTPVYKTEGENSHFNGCVVQEVSRFSCLKNIRRCSKPPPVTAQNSEGRLLFWLLSLSLSLPNHLFSAGTYLPRILNNFVTFPLDRGLWISIRFPQL